jgi:acetolactate decarboxylase
MERKRIGLVLVVALLMTSSGLLGYWMAPGEGNDLSGDARYFQVSTYASLSAGGYRGVITIEELLEKGGLGIGTVEGIDGEMMILDGVAYRAGTDMVPHEVPQGTGIPFAMVADFDEDAGDAFWANDVDNYTVLQELFYEQAGDHIVSAVLVQTEFGSLTIRSVPGQQEPYPPLAEVIAAQSTTVLHDISGSLIGFVIQEGLGEVNVAGFHLHFLSDDLSYGGHVLDVSFEMGQVWSVGLSEVQVIDAYR